MEKNSHDDLTPREKNWIITAVNLRQTAEEAGLKTVAEKEYYNVIHAEAEALFARGGVWPIFELWELD